LDKMDIHSKETNLSPKLGKKQSQKSP